MDVLFICVPKRPRVRNIVKRRVFKNKTPASEWTATAGCVRVTINERSRRGLLVVVERLAPGGNTCTPSVTRRPTLVVRSASRRGAGRGRGGKFWRGTRIPKSRLANYRRGAVFVFDAPTDFVNNYHRPAFPSPHGIRPSGRRPADSISTRARQLAST